MTPPRCRPFPYNKSGVVTASSTIGSCTWVATTSGTATTYATYPYPLTATYAENGVTVTATVPISMATAANCNDGQTPATDRPSSPEREQAARVFPGKVSVQVCWARLE